MRNLVLPTAIALMAVLLWSCRGKEGPQGPVGPQGPAGEDLVRPRQGYIRGTARGRDNNGASFNFSFSYSFYLSSPGIWRSIDANTREFSFSREDSLGIGSLSLTFRHDASNNTISNLSLGGTAADISSQPVPTYSIQQLPSVPGFFSGTTQTVSNLVITGDSISGQFTYIRPAYNNVPGVGTNTHADTVEGSFAVKLIPTRNYGRTTGQ
ncbi:MAG: hypothetical protein N2170_02660 [Bacteroidia bacterium]|nr:hypothetical protein [Bacteroidia bacterium]